MVDDFFQKKKVLGMRITKGIPKGMLEKYCNGFVEGISTWIGEEISDGPLEKYAARNPEGIPKRIVREI